MKNRNKKKEKEKKTNTKIKLIHKEWYYDWIKRIQEWSIEIRVVCHYTVNTRWHNTN